MRNVSIDKWKQTRFIHINVTLFDGANESYSQYLPTLFVCIRMYVHTNMYAHTYTYRYRYISIYVCLHICIHTYIGN